MTGVDRVELAYLRYLLNDSVPLFGLVRSSLGYVLLDAQGSQPLLARLQGDQRWGMADGLSRLARKATPAVRQAESDLRRFALARCLPHRLGRMLKKHLPPGAHYFNVGHSNLTERTLRTVRDDLNARLHVMVHDTIPLDYPQYQRPGTPKIFEGKLRRIRRFADLVIYNSQDTQTRAETHMAAWGNVPGGVAAPLGVEAVRPDQAGLPPHLDLSQPYFVTIGTIEPRKNHALILDTWDLLKAEDENPPALFICGARGWNNDAVFARLDAMAPEGPIYELNDLYDAAIAALVQSARAMIFPSEAEGYGLPPIEATMLGTPVICMDLAVYHETLCSATELLPNSRQFRAQSGLISG